MAGRQPDYDLSALNKETEERGRIGAAWANDDGTISIKLNAFVVLRDAKDTVITLFPRDKDRATKRKSRDEEDIPF